MTSLSSTEERILDFHFYLDEEKTKAHEGGTRDEHWASYVSKESLYSPAETS